MGRATARGCARTSLFAALVAFACVAGLAPAPARGQITYFFQDREIFALAGNAGNVEDRASAPAFGDFDRTVSVVGPNPDGYPDSYGSASQRSSLTPIDITMSGTLSGRDAYPVGDNGHGHGGSVLYVGFDLTEPRGYTFSATASRVHPVLNSTARLFYDSAGPGPLPIFDWNAASEQPSTGHFETAGLLLPGRYRLQLEFRGGWVATGAGEGINDYSARLLIPEPGAAGVTVTALLGLLARRRRSAPAR
jgi:hypothetical protein